MKKILIAGTTSGVGKTTLSLGIMKALKQRGLVVQPYKIGPDYIDTAYHTHVAGRASRNLDLYMLEEEQIKYLFNRSMKEADIGVVEGVMGLYDGKGTDITECSSAAVAKSLGLPVILVIDARAMGASSAAMVFGYKMIDPSINIVGVIANGIRTKGHFKLVKESIEKYCQIPTLGYLPPADSFSLPSRHLGLVPSDELEALEEKMAPLAEAVEKYIDLELLLNLAEGEEVVSDFKPMIRQNRKKKCMAVAYDEAFNFYYQDNLQLLEDLGVRLVYFSPLRDTELPSCDVIYIGGGFPEVFAKELEANKAMRAAIRKAHEANIPIYAECGGLMYLGERLVDDRSNSYEMVGIFEGESRMTNGLRRFGYCFGTAIEDTLLSTKGQVLKGHEFHHSEFHTKEKAAYKMQKEEHGESWPGGYIKGNTLATYLHLHFYSHLEAIERLLSHGGEEA